MQFTKGYATRTRTNIVSGVQSQADLWMHTWTDNYKPLGQASQWVAAVFAEARNAGPNQGWVSHSGNRFLSGCLGMDQFYRQGKKIGLLLSEKFLMKIIKCLDLIWRRVLSNTLVLNVSWFSIRKPFGLLDSTVTTARGKQTTDGKL